ncbi:sensor histidine kinase [Paenibacillus agricola]|uniref:Histidine kinase n=1 Tax=Paenibacillus agricola TaxID=2716264 RepID=A0ABX0J4Q3_9BACL|nr:histidine kinase [Paenibacillus agricola]NHN30801.1 histidine kinase [Paenibacillus agricola]
MAIKLNGRTWWFSIFTKLLAMFFIVVLPVYALALQMNDLGSGIVRDEVSNSLRSQLHFYNNTFTKEMDRIIRLQREYVNDNDLTSLSVIAEGLTFYERSEMMKQFQRKLDLMKSSGIYVQKASAYIPPIRRVISTEELSDTISTEVVENLKQAREMPHNSPLYYADGVLLLREFYPSLPASPLRDPLFVLETEVSVSQLQQFLQQIAGAKGEAALINDGWIISSSDSQYEQEPIAAKVREWVKGKGNAAQGIESIELNKQTYITAYEYSPEMDTTLIVYVPEVEVLGPLNKYKSFIIVMSIVTAVLIVIVSYWVYQVIHKPLTKMVRAFRKVESGNLSVSLHHKSRDEFSYLYVQFNEMTSKLNTLVYEVYEQKLQTQQAELNQLQSQINPHFLYNSLYLLYRMTKAEDYENSLKFTKYLGDYFRYITKKTGDDVRLEEEWHHVRMYMEIQNVRFSNRVEVMIGDLPEAARSVMVPRLILQPLVENAYNYGLEHTTSDGLLAVTLEQDVNELRIFIEDNGTGMPEAELTQWASRLASRKVNAEVSGIMNVHRRLQLKFGEDSGLILAAGAAGGLKVVMKIRNGKAEGETYATLNAGR